MLSVSSLLLSVIAFFLAMVGYYVMRYKWKVGRIPKSFPRHPTTWALIQKFSDKPGDYEVFIKSFFNPDGTAKSMLNLGPSLGGDPILSFCDPEAIKEGMTNPSMYPKYPPTYEVLAACLGKGMVVLEGDQWKTHRRVSTPLFHHQALKLMVRSMTRVAEDMADHLKTLKGQPVSFEFYQRFTMRVIIATTFGDDFDPEWAAPRFHQLTRLMNPYAFTYLLFGSYIASHLPFGPNKKINVVREEIKQALRDRIAKRRKELKEHPITTEETSDLLTMLLLHDLKEDEIIDEGLTFLFAGSDTTSYLLSWVSYYLCKHPRVQDRVSEECHLAINDDGFFDDASLNKMPYLRNVIRETLRLRPPVTSLQRRSDRDCVLNGTAIPAGVVVDLNFHIAHLDPKQWRSPLEFIPERFEEDSRHHPFAYVPFSAGERNCIGQKVAMQQAMMFIATLMKHFEMSSDTIEDVKMFLDPLLQPQFLTIKFQEKHST
eukprot:TRINITY_DN3016_c0_g1_i1.p1 TRINITY_DN3016_c0_g1~~TRINITY_DN3016_c0_g1_i1.p1  ORF type:complete len:486 (+),score=105.35 TRINITY_DN3016_c0_g1_i1:114-1571(+)